MAARCWEVTSASFSPFLDDLGELGGRRPIVERGPVRVPGLPHRADGGGERLPGLEALGPFLPGRGISLPQPGKIRPAHLDEMRVLPACRRAGGYSPNRTETPIATAPPTRLDSPTVRSMLGLGSRSRIPVIAIVEHLDRFWGDPADNDRPRPPARKSRAAGRREASFTEAAEVRPIERAAAFGLLTVRMDADAAKAERMLTRIPQASDQGRLGRPPRRARVASPLEEGRMFGEPVSEVSGLVQTRVTLGS